jgi:hypothetical protein
MNALELLENYPKTAQIIQKWFIQRMIDSLNDKDIPEEFKEFVRNTGIDHDKLAKMIDANPRSLVDVFDENDIHIITMIALEADGAKFSYKILPRDANKEVFDYCDSRKYAETLAVEDAFKELEGKL